MYIPIAFSFTRNSAIKHSYTKQLVVPGTDTITMEPQLLRHDSSYYHLDAAVQRPPRTALPCLMVGASGPHLGF